MAEVKPDKHGWMPIETAPRDGEAIFLFTEEAGVVPAEWSDVAHRWESTKGVEHFADATHWQPIPSAPVELGIPDVIALDVD